MSWFLVALLGYLALALVFVLDKLILTKTLDAPVVYTFYSTIFMFAALLVWPFGVELLVGIDWLWALVSGMAFGFGMWAMFIGVKRGDASHINPMIGGITTISIFVLASALLSESLTISQTGGMIVLLCATLMLSLEKHGKKTLLHPGSKWAVVAGLLFAVSHTSAKYLYDVYPFVTGFVWTRATTGFVGIVCLFFPSVWKTFKRPASESNTIRQCKDCGFAQKHALGIILGDKILGVVGVVLIQYAIALGSVTLVNALVGIQYALMFLLIFLLTKFAPKIFKEEFTKRELVIELIAIFFVVAGSGLFVF